MTSVHIYCSTTIFCDITDDVIIIQEQKNREKGLTGFPYSIATGRAARHFNLTGFPYTYSHRASCETFQQYQPQIGDDFIAFVQVLVISSQQADFCNKILLNKLFYFKEKCIIKTCLTLDMKKLKKRKATNILLFLSF